MPRDAAEPARATWLALFPEGFEEHEAGGVVELVGYGGTDAERRARERFPQLVADAVEPGWEDRWRAFHVPVVIGPLWIGPPWEQPPGESTPVVIDPGRAFGTGAHATTRLCLELLVALRPGSLLDLGTGSGVVAIAAAKLGFAPVHAIDVDAAAAEAARRNADANGVAVAVRLADARTSPLPAADVAVANISLAAVEALAPRLACERFVSSGYLERDRPQPPAFDHLDRRTRDGWAADLFRRR